MPSIDLEVTGTKVTLEPITAQTFSLTVPSAVPAVVTALAVGPQGPQGEVGPAGPQGPGTAGAFRYLYNSASTQQSPGTGAFIVERAVTFTTSTHISISNTSDTGVAMDTAISSWDDSTTTNARGYLIISNADLTVQAQFVITGAVASWSGYKRFTVSWQGGAQSLTNGGTYYITFVRTGDKGATGATGPQGEQGPGVPFGGATNDLLVKQSATSFDTAWQDTITVDAIQFDTAADEGEPATGELVWNAEEGTVDLGLNGANSTFLHVGQEMVYRVSNKTGSQIAKGAVVGFGGTVGNSGRLLGRLFDASSHAAKTIMGMAAEAIPNDADGYVVAFGKVRKIKTDYTGWVEGDILYADPATPGGLTRVRPTSPNAIVTVAALVTRSATVGEVFVRPTFAPALTETQDVRITTPADGQVLTYDSGTGLWVNEAVPTDSVVSVNGQQGTVVLDAADVGAYADSNPSGFVDAAGAAAAAPVQSVNGAQGTVVLTTSNVAEGTALYFTAARAAAAAPVQSVNGGTGVVTITAAGLGAYLDTNPAGYITSAQAPVQSVNGAAGTVVLTTSDVAEGTALYYTDVRAAAAAPVQSVNGGTGVVSLDYTDVNAVGTAIGVYVYDYGTAIPSVRPDAAAVYWRGTAAPGTAIASPGDLWYDTTGD